MPIRIDGSSLSIDCGDSGKVIVTVRPLRERAREQLTPVSSELLRQQRVGIVKQRTGKATDELSDLDAVIEAIDDILHERGKQ